MNEPRRRLVALAIITSFIAQLVVAPGAVRASILAGCVAPEDAGVSGLVGWVDVGVMLGVAEPVPPASLRATAPDGSVVDYRDGVGLLTPTDTLPIWFAPAPLMGDYELVIDGGERCTVSVRGGSDSPPIVDDEIKFDWAPRSAPAKGN